MNVFLLADSRRQVGFCRVAISTMRYLLVLISSIFVNVPTVLLVLVYARFGTFADSAGLGIALAYAAPLHLFFSMQHGVAILAGNLSWCNATALRVKLAPFYLISAIAISIIYKEWLIFWVALYRFGDLLYEPVFSERMRSGDSRRMLVGSGGRLFVFLIGLLLGLVLGLEPTLVLAILAGLNIAMALWSAGSEWYASVRRAVPDWAGVLMGAGACLASVSVNVPRYFLAGARVSELAAYSNILTVVMAGTLLFVSFNNLLFAKASREGLDGVVSFFLRSNLLGLFVMPLACFLVFRDFAVAKMLVVMGLGANYQSYANLLPLFWVFYCLLYLQNVANCVLIYLGGGRQIFVSNFLLLIFLAFGFLYPQGEVSSYRALIVVVISMVVFLLVMTSLVFLRLRGRRGLVRKFKI